MDRGSVDEAVPILSRLLRSVQVLVGICQSDFGEELTHTTLRDSRIVDKKGCCKEGVVFFFGDSSVDAAIN